MGKSIPSATRFQEFARIITSDRIKQQAKPISRNRIAVPPPPERAKPKGVRGELEKVENLKTMEESSSGARGHRMPLSAVVLDCSKRWFQDALREAKAGDASMQVLVGQMYYSGYGVPKDEQKGRSWIKRASKSRTSAWKVGDKRPGYNASDSDSDDDKADRKQG